MNILFSWCDPNGGLVKAISVTRTIIEVVRFAVPIGLIIMTSLDIFKKVINPDDKDGQKKILNRIIAGLIVFMVPIMVRFILKLADVGGKPVSGSGLYCLWELVK